MTVTIKFYGNPKIQHQAETTAEFSAFNAFAATYYPKANKITVICEEEEFEACKNCIQ